MVDIEATIIAYLKNAGYAAYADVPNPRPETFVTVERTGGGLDSLVIDRPTVAVQSWANTRLEASKLSMEVDGHLRQMALAIPDVCYVERDSLYNWPDEYGNNARYQGVYHITTQ